jgi:hypothetical protein
VPSFVGRKLFRRKADLRGHAQLELDIGDLEEGEELSYEDADVGLVDEGVGELEGAAADGDVAVAEAVEDDGAVAKDGVRVDGDDLVEGVEGDVADVVVLVAEELAQAVDGHHPQALFRLVEDGVADVLARLGVGGDLRQDVVHRFGRLRVTPPNQAHQP